MDDAYISFRYASNFAGGLGLVFNPGQFVKGFSNTLWTLLMTGPEWAGISPLLFSKLLGIASYLTLVGFVYDFAKTSYQRKPSDLESRKPLSVEHFDFANYWPAFPVLLIALSTPISVWYMSGMETGLYTTLVVAAVLTRLREQQAPDTRPYSTVLFVLCIVSRPEGIIFFVAMAAHDLAFRVVRRQWSTMTILWYLLPPTAYGLELWWSNAYFGAPFPQPFYTKVQPESLAEGPFMLTIQSIVMQFSSKGYFFPNLIKAGGFGVIGLGILACFRRERFRQSAALSLMVLAQLLFISRVGGDWMPACRFLVPILPFLFLLLTEGLFVLIATSTRWRKFSLHPIVLLAATALFLPQNYSMSSDVFNKEPVSARRKLREGRTLGSLVEPGRSICTVDIGGIGYASRLDLLDTYGLTDRFMGYWRLRNVRACVQYVILNRTDVIRRHPSHRVNPDESIYRTARSSGQYVALNDQRTLVRKALVFPRAIPEDAQAVSWPTTGSNAVVVAIKLPSVVRPGSSIDATLYWRVSSTHPETLFSRQVELRSDEDLKFSIGARSLITRMDSDTAWTTSGLVADYIAFTAPTATGLYPFNVSTPDTPGMVRVASLNVVTDAEAKGFAIKLRARADKLFEQGLLEQAIAVCRVSARLGDPQSETRYVELVTHAADQLMREGQTPLGGYSMSALSSAKFILDRAYYDLGHATAPLRESINAVEKVKAEILERSLLTAVQSNESGRP